MDVAVSDIGRGQLRLRRSVLIAAGDNADLLPKMASSRADVCIVDWEDGVLPGRKEMARKMTHEALQDHWHCVERVVRVNDPATPWYPADIAAAVATGADAIMIPKVNTGAEIEHASSLIADAENACGRPVGSVMVWALIETAAAILNLEEIAAGPRMTAMIFGGGDLGADLRVKRIQLGAGRTLGPMRFEYIYAMGRFVVAARAAGIDPVATGYTSYRDLEGTRHEAEICAQFGFAGSLAISPRQIATLHEVFSPSAEDVAWATEVLSTVEAAGEDDLAVAVVDGAMIDGPFVRSARHLRALDALAATQGTPAAAVVS